MSYDPIDDDGGVCPVCDNHAGESSRCHRCERCVHEGCFDVHNCATMVQDPVTLARRETRCSVCDKTAWRESDPVNAPGHSDPVACDCFAELDPAERDVLRAAASNRLYSPFRLTYRLAAVRLVQRELATRKGRYVQPTERGLAAITCSVAICR